MKRCLIIGSLGAFVALILGVLGSELGRSALATKFPDLRPVDQFVYNGYSFSIALGFLAGFVRELISKSAIGPVTKAGTVGGIWGSSVALFGGLFVSDIGRGGAYHWSAWKSLANNGGVAWILVGLTVGAGLGLARGAWRKSAHAKQQDRLT